MQFIPAWETEEKNTHKIISSAILFLWFMTFIINGIAYSIYYQANEVAEKFYIRTLLEMQAKILLIQAISGILWFIITLYILISTLMLEKREKFNVLSGIMFFASGVAEIGLSIYMLRIREEFLGYVRKFPVLSLDELYNKLMDLTLEVNTIAFIASAVISISIGGAFIFLGISVRKSANEIMSEVMKIQPPIQAQIQPVEQTVPLTYESYVGSAVFGQIFEGVKKMKSGGNMYIISGILDMAGILISFLGFLSFIFFIIGIVQVNSGRKRILEGRNQLLQLMAKPTEEEKVMGGESE